MMQETANALSDVLLERLADIHSAAEPAWWPPAPGWWVLGVLLLAVVAWLLARAIARLRAHLRRRRLLRQLDALAETCDPRSQPSAYLAALNRVFRKIALRAFPDSGCGRLQGDAWVAFIRARLPGESANGLDALASGPYRPNPEFDASELRARARTWVARYG